MTHERITRHIIEATQEVFATMLGAEVIASTPHTADEPPASSDGVVSLIGLAGEWIGTGLVCGSAESARRIAGLLMASDYDDVNDEVLDAVGELTNMIFGNVKTALEADLGSMGLSIPTVIYGRNFTTRSVGRREWSVVRVESQTPGEFSLELGMALAPKSSGHHHLLPSLAVGE